MQNNDSERIVAPKKIWIDIDNSPHVPFFRPIINELEKRGYPIFLTARDCYQVCGLMDMFSLKYARVGRHSGKNKARKLVGLFYRACQLATYVAKERPVLAVSHGSRAQIILARMLHIPSVGCDDYEQAKDVPFFKPRWLIRPEVIPDDANRIIKKHVLKYPGIKEDVYVPDFEPNPAIKQQLGINGKEITVTIRPPATEAHYFRQESKDLFDVTLNYLGRRQDIRMVLLPRNETQTAWIKKEWPEWCANGRIIIPDQVVDGLNLIWHSDLVVSGGGTMNREAAALGVPVYSIFRGKVGAVDRYLADRGRLILLEGPEDVKTKIKIMKRQKLDKPRYANRDTLNTIVEGLISIIERKDVH